MWLVTMWRLMLDIWTTAPVSECTRCGGNHALSRCPWPTMKGEGNART